MTTTEPTLYPHDTIMDALDQVEAHPEDAEGVANIRAARNFTRGAATDYILVTIYQGVMQGMQRGTRAQVTAAWREFMSQEIAECQEAMANDDMVDVTEDWWSSESMGEWLDWLYDGEPDGEAWTYALTAIPTLTGRGDPACPTRRE